MHTVYHLNEVLVVLDDDVVLVELPVHVRLRPALRIQEDSISAWCNDMHFNSCYKHLVRDCCLTAHECQSCQGTAWPTMKVG